MKKKGKFTIPSWLKQVGITVISCVAVGLLLYIFTYYDSNPSYALNKQLKHVKKFIKYLDDRKFEHEEEFYENKDKSATVIRIKMAIKTLPAVDGKVIKYFDIFVWDHKPIFKQPSVKTHDLHDDTEWYTCIKDIYPKFDNWKELEDKDKWHDHTRNEVRKLIWKQNLSLVEDENE